MSPLKIAFCIAVLAKAIPAHVYVQSLQEEPSIDPGYVHTSIIQEDKSSPDDFFHCEMQIFHKGPWGEKRLSNITCAFI